MNETSTTVFPDDLQEEAQPVKKKKRISKPIQSLLDGDFLSREGVVNNLPYLAFLAIIAIIYIANTYYAEKTFKDIEATKVELKELRYQYISTKSNLMYLSKQSEIARRARMLGLTETKVPPYKIFYSGLAQSAEKEN
ncbi:FtsL-like putative cell division protein [Bacteroidota bacterium]